VTRPDTIRPDILASIRVADTLMPPSLVRPIAMGAVSGEPSVTPTAAARPHSVHDEDGVLGPLDNLAAH
jgi:hypothetical protein